MQGITDPLYTNTDLSRKECRPLKQAVPKNCLQMTGFPADGLVSLLLKREGRTEDGDIGF
jgi:hypothetical protein